ncbi:MAG: type II toxin-antitoxin system RelE/ParE family toxin [Alphaproteobacteria bacterium]|nr:type II toxin-antitoxin system RelE/ParE family toxin [Alphaproteobacteria bacterium]
MIAGSKRFLPNGIQPWKIPIYRIFFCIITRFRDDDTRRFHSGKRIKRWEAFEAVALRKLDFVLSAVRLADLKIPPNNKLKKLKGTRSDEYSIRINDQWRIVFRWGAAGAYDIAVEDYH